MKLLLYQIISQLVLALCLPEHVSLQRLLSNEHFVKYLADQIDFLFLQTNDFPDVSRCTLWETMKAYIRGIIILYTDSEHKRLSARQTELHDKIQQVDRQHASAPTPELFKERLLLQTEYNIMSTSQTQDLHLRSCFEHYEHGECAGKLLSHQLRKSESANQIREITEKSPVIRGQ